jgi:hypothetical protein
MPALGESWIGEHDWRGSDEDGSMVLLRVSYLSSTPGIRSFL